MRIPFYFLCLYLFSLVFQPQFFYPWLAQFRPALIFAIGCIISGTFGHLSSTVPHKIKSKKNILLMLFLIFAALSWVMPSEFNDPYRSKICNELFIHLSKLIFLYIAIIVVLRDQKSILGFIWITLIFFVVNGLISAGMYHWGKLDYRSYRMASYFGGMASNTNEFGMIMVMLIPIALSLFGPYYKSAPLRLILIIAIPVFLYGITRSYSRGAFLGLIITAPMILVLNRKNKGIIILMVLFATFIFFKTPGKYYDRMTSIWNRTSFDDSGAIKSRLRLQKESIYLIKNYPIFGVGIGSFQYALYKLGIDEKYGAAHNTYLGIAAEMGIVSGLIFISIIIISAKELYFAAKKFREEELLVFKSLCSHLIISIIAFSVCGLFISQEYNRLLYIIFGLSTVLKNQAQMVGSNNGAL